MGADGSMRRIASELASPPPDRLGCEEYLSDVLLYVDGELAEAERVAVELHLKQCAVCDRGARFSLRLRESIRSQAQNAVRAPAGLHARLRKSLDQQPARTTIQHRLSRFLTPLPAAAAGATAMGVTAWLWFAPPPADITRDLVARHTRRLPLEIQSSDPQSLESWLADKVDFNVHIPRPENAPLSLLGARLSHVKDRSAVYLMYGNPNAPNHRISLLVYGDGPDSRPPPIEGQPVQIADHQVYTANRSGYNVAVWRRNEVVYSLVSDTDDDVLELVRAATSKRPP